MRVTGFTIKVNKKDDVLRATKQAEQRVLTMWGILAQGYATEYAPVDTGNLRNSIGYGTSENEMQVGTNVEYAPYQELGTYKMAAHPYLRPAIENHISEYESILADEVAKLL